jgi:hypothetical protein
VVEHPGIGILKTQRIGTGHVFTRATLVAQVGQTVHYRMVVANTGDVTLTITFSDPRCDAGTLQPTGTQTIAPATSLTYTCSHLLKASDGNTFTNTATATGTTPKGDHTSPVSSSVAVTKPGSGTKGTTHTITKPDKPAHGATTARAVVRGAHFTG